MNTIVKNMMMTLAAASSVAALAGDPSAPYQDSKIEARLNLEVQKDTEVLHFVRANADPDVVTKTYVLKHADPYEIRAYLREIVQTRRVDESDSGITAIRYNDGTGILLVSAEDYRFEDSENGQGIDTIVETLDQPKITSVTGQPMYLYTPKYRAASELQQMVRVAGANIADDVTEAIGGSDRVRHDYNLNLMFFKTTLFSRSNIEKVLKEYDRPYPELRARITVYEIFAENDAKLGLDFQAWKNAGGLDLFSIGGSFMQNYSTATGALVPSGGWNDIKYVNFNPKWNTRYIDFLASKGKAKVLLSSELAVRNNTACSLARETQSFYPALTPAASKVVDEGGNDIEVAKGNTVKLEAVSYGFNMTLTPSIGEKAATLDVNVSNTSLIGFNSDGSPRLSPASVVDGNFMIANNGTKLVIGGVEKREVVSVSGGLPILKDLPLVGWLFSTESESTKKSQLLVVAEVLPVRPEEAMPESVKSAIGDIESKLGAAGESNTFGFSQYGLDSSR